MKTIYHIITIAFVIYELTCIVDFKEKIKNLLRFNSIKKDFKGKKYDEWTQEYKDLATPRAIIGIIFLIWAMAGLVTYNWGLFILFIITQVLLVGPIMKSVRGDNFIYKTMYVLNSIFGFLFGILILLNSYHLKIDFFELVKTYFMK
jgi:hypothetical protein